MSDEDDFSTTLAYNYKKSPKVARKTAFQHELHKAVAARMAKQIAVEENDYLSDFDDYDDNNDGDDDDMLKSSMSTKKCKRSGKASRKKNPGNNFILSDDEEEKPQKISFLKSRRKDSPNVSAECDYNLPSCHNLEGSNKWEEKGSEEEEKLPKPQPRNHRMKSTPVPGNETTCTVLDECPKPKPRQRRLKMQCSSTQDDESEKSCYTRASSALSKHSSAISKTLVTERQTCTRSPSPEDSRLINCQSKTSFLNVSRHTSSSTCERHEDSVETRVDSCIRDEDLADNGDNSNSELRSYTPMELIKRTEEQETIDPEDFSKKKDNNGEKVKANMTPQGGKRQKTESFEKSVRNRPLSSQTMILNRCFVGKGLRPNSAEPRYLGTLKILDIMSPGNATSNLENADTIRASIYQEWLQKKTQQLYEAHKNKRLNEQQEKEKKQKEKIEGKEEAKASFDAWMVKKENVLKETCKKKKEEVQKKIKEAAEKEERREIAKKAVFEKWKQEKDEYLKEKCKKQRQIEIEKKKQEEEKISEKKTASLTAFQKWSEKKEVLIKRKLKEKIQEEQRKKHEEEYIKYEKEETALAVYEEWLEKKEQQEKREKSEKKIMHFLNCEPPPWSPPNKTIPYRK
uniref:Microtubule-associated protein 9 n=1 Tax=Callorhinchus milii TaxID=7868 RepID=V9KGH8_CALMI